ncbi:unnamed protein product [Cyclocybe aegerita]|uniref:F-box domain-containing protein n=1 Tax=Cyclocybe aegerita TaxID=1973307 RepID=A0A8S0VUK3_CYCAE|nr:unnamed protein product [Cyclocybe aegerita]
MDSDEGEPYVPQFDIEEDPYAGYPPEVMSGMKINDLPSEATLCAALAFREEPSITVPEFDARIATLEARMKELETQKKALEEEAEPYRRKLKACDAVLAPIRRVPFDILREIVRLTLPRWPSASTKQGPLALCRVSSAFRRATLSLPELWTTLHMVLEEVLSFHRYITRVEKWFKRARGKPCSLYTHFHFPPQHVKIAKNAYAIFLNGVRSSVACIRHLGISAKFVADALVCFEKAGWMLPNLETLELRSGEMSDAEWAMDERPPDPTVVIPSMELFKTANSLHSVTIDGDFVRTLGGRGLLPWAQMTTIILTEWLRPDDWAEIMSSCPQMQIGRFRIVANWIPESGPPKRTLAHLEELRLCIMYSSASIIDLVDVFHLPKLRILDLQHDIDYGNEVSEPLPAKDVPAFKTVETLYFADVWQETTPLYVLEMLTEMTNLREVELTDIVSSETYDALFKAMSFNQPIPILPKLSSFSVTATKKVTDWAMFVEMVHSRCFNIVPDLQPLKELKIVIRRRRVLYSRERRPLPAIGDLKAALQACEDTGLALKVADDYDKTWLCQGQPGVNLFHSWSPWNAIYLREFAVESAS